MTLPLHAPRCNTVSRDSPVGGLHPFSMSGLLQLAQAAPRISNPRPCVNAVHAPVLASSILSSRVQIHKRSAWGAALTAAACGFVAASSRRRRCALVPRGDGATASKTVEAEKGTWGESFNWKKAWYPLAVVVDLEPDRPHKLELLGEGLVAWRDKDGQWHVWEDRCPHRNVPLSEGRLEKDGTLLCSYHGWRFDKEGQVVAIPQAPPERLQELLKNKRACASVRPSQIRLGVLFVWGECSENAALESALTEPNFPEEAEDPALAGRVTLGTWSHHDLPYGWEVAMENISDPAHLAVSHHGTASNRYADPTPLRIDVSREPSNKQGFAFRYRMQNKEDLACYKKVKGVSTADFRPPSLFTWRNDYDTGASEMLLINFVPTRPGFSRLLFSTVVIKGPRGETTPGYGPYTAPIPRWLDHLLIKFFVVQDEVFLHHQQVILHKEKQKTGQDWASLCWTPTESDKGTIIYQKWLTRNPLVWPPGSQTTVTESSDKKVLFDFYRAHTCSCATCKKALRRVSALQTAFKFTAIAAASAGVAIASWPVLLGSVGLGLGAAACSQVRSTYYEVSFHHQDNN